MSPEATRSTCWRGQGWSGAHLGSDRGLPGPPRGRPWAARGAPGGSGTVRRSTGRHAEEPNGGDAEGRRREGEANASRNRRNRLLEKARHVSRRDTAD